MTVTALGAAVAAVPDFALADVEDVGRPGAMAAAPPAVLLLATTVMAASCPAALVETELVGRPGAMDVAFPPDAFTVTAAPAMVVVVAATSPSCVKPDMFTDTLEFAATALEPPPPAMTVTPAGLDAPPLAAVAFPPALARTVTADPAALVVVAAMRPS